MNGSHLRSQLRNASDREQDDTPFVLVDQLYNEARSGYDWHDLVLLYNRETGTVYLNEDSGCSCNSMWDGVETLSDLDGYVVTRANLDEEIVRIRAFPADEADRENMVRALWGLFPRLP